MKAIAVLAIAAAAYGPGPFQGLVCALFPHSLMCNPTVFVPGPHCGSRKAC